MPAARNATLLVRCRSIAASSLCLLLLGAGNARAADIAEASELFASGQYSACSALCEEAIESGEYSVTWRMLKIQSDLARGRYPAALETLEAALKRFRTSIRIRWLGRTVYQYNGMPDRAAGMLAEIDALTRRSSWRYSDPLSRVTLGRYFLERGADPKQVLDAIYSEVKRRTRSFVEPFAAAGELALEKNDYALAAEEFRAALELDARNADIHFGLARAYSNSDTEKAEQHLNLALERNPQHVDSLLFLAGIQIDAERFEAARELLARVLLTHISEPRAWAYLAVLAHLENNPASEEVCRRMALSWWTTNPAVDSLIGAKLSQKYRFREGAAYQRRALELDPGYLPAKIALSQDLLRLGEEEAGWSLANEVYEADGYNVVAHNLVTLEENVAGYRTLTTPDFVVRMAPREADIYGDRVLDLLTRAKHTLCEKYAVQIDDPIYVEIFAQQADFAIRTFGLPGGAGFLGVCFGNVITANSPASQADQPSNWEAVLWHEFCHVVTLHKTHNKMPRWLSEGISVYEELQENPAWGQRMTPEYREMILSDDFTPVSRLSGAFLQPESPLHLQFAYFEAELVVEFLVETYGLDTVKRILVDLGVGLTVNESLERYTGSLVALDEEFAAFARQQADDLAPQMDWERPELSPQASLAEWESWNQSHPNNYWGLLGWSRALLAAEQWESAKRPLKRLIELFSEDNRPPTAYALLAQAHRELNETEQERALLQEWARRSGDATSAYQRLMEIAAEQTDWQAVRLNAERMLAVNPLVPAPHRYFTQAAEALEEDAAAVEGLRVLANMEPRDPADIHFRLATRLHRLGHLAAAKREILRSLEAAPRYREAHRKLLEIVQEIQENDDTGQGPS